MFLINEPGSTRMLFIDQPYPYGRTRVCRTKDDPATGEFDTLLEQDEQQQITPRLALAWRTVNDTTWEFKLRPGVKFSDGSDFTANDAIYSFCRVPQIENSPSSMAINVRAITGMTAPESSATGS